MRAPVLRSIALVAAALMVVGPAAPSTLAQTGSGDDGTTASGQLSVTTDATRYAAGGIVRIHLTNTGSTTIEGTPEYWITTADGAPIFSPGFAQVVQTLDPGRTITMAWDQTTDKGTPASAGTYVAHGSMGGHTDTASFEIAGGTSGGNVEISFAMDRLEYATRENVPASYTNSGEDTFDGTLELTVVRGGDVVWNEGVRTATVRSGEVRTWNWEQETFSGSAAAGTYDLRIDWRDASGVGGTAQATVELGERVATGAPVLDVTAPAGGQATAERVPLRFETADPDGIQRYQVYAWGGSGPVAHLRSWTSGADGTTSTGVDTEIEASRFPNVDGTNRLYVVVVDGSNAVTVDVRSITVSGGGEPRVDVITDKDAYGPGEQVRIHLTNAGPTTLFGTAHFNVTSLDARGVRYPDRYPGIQEVVALDPGGSITFSWDLHDDDGTPVPAGTYAVYAGIHLNTTGALVYDSTRFEVRSDGLAPPEPAITLRIVSPAKGATIGGPLSVSLHIGGVGATGVRVDVTGPSNVTAERSFAEPVTGDVRIDLDPAHLDPGQYRVHVVATGPGPAVTATTSFSVLPPSDTDVLDPTVRLTYPRGGDRVPTRFPIVFTADDDTGILYAEVHATNVDGVTVLVARHSWPAAVRAGAVVVDATRIGSGPATVTLRVFDIGEHGASATVDVDVDPAANLPCGASPTLAASAQPTWCGTYGYGSTLPPVPEPSPSAAGGGAPRASLTYDVARNGDLRNVTVGGSVVIERINASLGAVDDGGPAAAADARIETPTGRVTSDARRLAISSATGDLVTLDLNADLVLTQRGRNILLEAPDGTRLVVAVTDGDLRVLGSRVLAQVASGAEVVTRPIDDASPVERAMVDGLVAGTVGAEVDVAREGSRAQAYSPMDVDVTVEDSPQGPRVVARLDSTRADGRTVVFALDPSIEVGESIAVALDGQPVAAADSLEDVLDLQDDGGRAEYYVVIDDGTPTVLVSVDHFSARTVTIQSLEAFLPPFVTPAALAVAVAVVAAAAVFMFRRPEMP